MDENFVLPCLAISCLRACKYIYMGPFIDWKLQGRFYGLYFFIIEISRRLAMVVLNLEMVINDDENTCFELGKQDSCL